jgi:hypothetical protein
MFYTLRQAELAQKVYANAEAGEHYTRALALLDMQEAQCVDDANAGRCANSGSTHSMGAVRFST